MIDWKDHPYLGNDLGGNDAIPEAEARQAPENLDRTLKSATN